jgi:hypothetical protein
MVTHVVGRLGSGKTMWAVQKITELLMSSEIDIYTNIKFRDYWDYSLASHKLGGLGSFIKFLLSPFYSRYAFKKFLAGSYVNRYHYFSDISSAVERCMTLPEAKEGTRLFVWDEIHLDLNSRSWKSTSMDMIKFFSMSRKLGFDVVIVSQLRGAVDRQMRDLADISFELKNMKHFRPFGLPIFPEVGLLVKRWANKGFDVADKSIMVGAGVVRYGSYVGKVYNTMQLLTERIVEPPKAWYGTSVSEKCSSCVYQDFYIMHHDFVSEYASGPDKRDNQKLPIRRMISITSKE